MEISNIEKVVYLLKLEILQWKGYEKKHIELSIDYCNKFDVMPPEYHKDGEKIRRMSQSNNSSGVVSVEKMKNTINDVSTDVLVYKVNEVNTQNLDYLIDYLKGCNQFVITIDFKMWIILLMKQETPYCHFYKSLELMIGIILLTF